MFANRIPRLITYHDTWISIDPIIGCPYNCHYCVLRHCLTTGVNPKIIATPQQCIENLFNYPFFEPGITPLSIGNETDLLHKTNQPYLVELLHTFAARKITNTISLITKAPLDEDILRKISNISELRIIFFLSYSGLFGTYEPNFSENKVRTNFKLVKSYGFPIVHYWRPLLPSNTTDIHIHDMLSFVSKWANTSVAVGLKLNPELNQILSFDGLIQIPDHLKSTYGEWIETDAISRIYSHVEKICPNYPVYRHTSCALAYILNKKNHTATVYRDDICLPSNCPKNQRLICQKGKCLPTNDVIKCALSRVGYPLSFKREEDRILIEHEVTQEEYSYLLHMLNCPITVKAIRFQNVYRGNIHVGQYDHKGNAAI